MGAHYWVLTALRECLAVADAVTLARYGGVTFGVAEHLLESDMPPMIFPPLLGVIMQACSALFCLPCV